MITTRYCKVDGKYYKNYNSEKERLKKKEQKKNDISDYIEIKKRKKKNG